ncbi:MAG: metalloregulator ArsR/SmtB family transcription factor [Chloroflexota bacterium]|jgi:ArsR family transcriptional regulator, arsenate/arsenite/antimonite-responsive transcriptional repressor
MNTLTEFPPACCTLDIDGRDQARLVQMFKALGNPIRFEIMKFLVTHPGCITGDIVEHLPVAQATVSQHLKVLRDAGWVEGIVDGPATHYCLSEAGVLWFRAQVDRVF